MSSIRLLILGVLQIRQPIHGYEVRRELERWRAEEWAHVAYGSIYSALKTMAEEGLVAATGTEQVGNRPARTAYAITARGRDEFARLLRQAWWEPQPLIDPFQVALTFMHRLPRDELLDALRYRAERLRVGLAGFTAALRHAPWPAETPRHIAENFRLATAHMETELRWIEEAIGKVERGELP